MRKFFIILSGVYIIIAGILIAAPSFSFLNESKDNLPIVIAGFLSLLIPGVLMVLTGIGIIRRKNWARYSLFVMSIFAIFTGLLTSLIVALVPQGEMSNRPIFSVVLLIFFIFLVVIPAYFLIFFTRKSVKEQFVSKEQELKKSPRPLGIKLIAILTFIGAVSSLIQVLFPPIQKFPIFGIFLSGISLRIYWLIFVVISFYIALGLWRLKKGG